MHFIPPPTPNQNIAICPHHCQDDKKPKKAEFNAGNCENLGLNYAQRRCSSAGRASHS